jgi:hypothetical protein
MWGSYQHTPGSAPRHPEPTTASLEATVDTERIAQSPAPITPDPEEHERLLEAARSALRLLDAMDQHAPEGLTFGDEHRVRCELRKAIRLAAS